MCEIKALTSESWAKQLIQTISWMSENGLLNSVVIIYLVELKCRLTRNKVISQILFVPYGSTFGMLQT